MYQRAGITRHPWSVLLLIVVLASAYPTAESSVEGLGCKEIVPSGGCVAVSVSATTYNVSLLSWEEETWDEYCQGSPVSFHFTFYDIDRGGGSSSQDLGVRVEWNITSGKTFYLKSVLNGDPETQETTSGAVNLDVLQDASDNPGKSLRISLLDPDNDCIVSETVLRIPKTCYGATSDQPQTSGPMLMNVTADEVVVMEGEEEMYWRVRWSWIQDQGRGNQIETYHVRVEEDEGRGEIRWLEVKEEMEVLIGNLSSSLYTISVWRYECGCDLSGPMGEMLLDPLSHPSEFFTTSFTVLPCSPPPPPPSSQLHPSPSTSSQLSLSSHSPHLTPSTAHHPPSFTTLTALPISTATPTPSTATRRAKINGETVAIISVTISASIVLVVAILIAITVFARKKKSPPNCDDQVDLNLSPLPLGRRSLSIVALYSIRTPAEDIDRINKLLACGLSDYNIKVETPDTTKPREMQKEWIEKGLIESHAVLLVCNRQFEEEWKGKADGQGQLTLTVASVVKVMLGSLGDSDRSKIKCVYLREEDEVYSNPSLLLRHPISLVDETQGLYNIARFVHNTPTYLAQ